MSKAAMDIGTNSMRLLIVDDDGNDLVRTAVVTGLGRGVDRARVLSDEAMARTIAVLERFGREADLHGARRRAVATSATRDAANRDVFLDRAETALGVRPDVITGAEEAELSYRGATGTGDVNAVVVDIGGGSTEFVFLDGRVTGVSVDIGSVRLTERFLVSRPATFATLQEASRQVADLFDAVWVPPGREVIGVAGTWTSLAAIVLEGEEGVHGCRLDRATLDHLVLRLAAMTIEETATLPGLDPARAPVILGGAIVARESARALGTEWVRVSERDLLDGIVAGL